MVIRTGLILAVCIAALFAAGCTGIPSDNTGIATAVPTMAATGTPEPSQNSGCPDEVCTFIPSLSSQTGITALRIETEPKRYSPMLSSTPGIRLTPNTTGFSASSAQFTWNASYGQFLSWNSPDYTVNSLGRTYTGNGATLYWSFTEAPPSLAEPVTISVTAKNTTTGSVLGTSSVILDWDKNSWVTVR